MLDPELIAAIETIVNRVLDEREAQKAAQEAEMTNRVAIVTRQEIEKLLVKVMRDPEPLP